MSVLFLFLYHITSHHYIYICMVTIVRSFVRSQATCCQRLVIAIQKRKREFYALLLSTICCLSIRPHPHFEFDPARVVFC